ncbi:TonB-dependent receptor [Paraglaciecola sp. MB-3u-78]|uniref:TonB-dependent receptor n=1 Tax=Paraglaciecola sp. MB-3u-78 TaxID=2058332 RepID=UPI000C34C5D3|nr:TonB-dependent receptor [Paraglaciecola sp. MB-3u-78]PKG97381.1 TonB-dependent receptor [Paraglaciecola sp. MB-3u-78]
MQTFHKRKITCAVLLAMASSVPVIAAESTAPEVKNNKIETIEVTATKRTESIQDIPVSVSALNGSSLENLGIDNFQDYVEFLPNVVFQGTGPGQNEIYIRGAATTQANIALSSVTALQPSVAFYLDEQPVSMQGRNLDIYATDMERVEVLPGPQGTLFGASSQSGTVRLITKKPDHSGVSGGFDSSVSFTRGGEMSNSVEAYFNLPVSDDTAIRAVVYNQHQGGWIDNVLNEPGTGNGSYQSSAVVIDRVSNGPLADPVNTPTISPKNDALVEDDFNDATYSGVRFGVHHNFNEDWSLLVQHTAQTLNTDGVFSYDPNLEGESSTNRFVPEDNQDEFGLTTWTLEGRLAKLDVVYTGGYLDRNIDSTIDYTGYTNAGLFSAFYTCEYSSADPADQYCADPTKWYKEKTETSRNTHELRFNTSTDNSWRVTAGVFYDDQTLASVGKFKMANTELFPDLNTVLKGQDGINSDGGPYSSEVSFVNDVNHQIKQVAVFGQTEYDLTDSVTATLGARWYQIEDIYKGATSTVDVSRRVQAFGSLDSDELEAVLPDNDSPDAVIAAIDSGQLQTDLLDADGVLTVDDVIYKASVDWKVNDDVLLFTTYSEGFRPPVTNRVGGGKATSNEGAFENFRIPVYSTTDTLKNYEVGMKGDFFDGILRVNATGYYSEITDLQTSRYDPTNISFLQFADNVGDAEIRGIDGDITWLATDNLVINGAFSWIDSELTRLNDELQGIAPPVGSKLPYSADLSANLRARYYFQLPNGWDGFVNGSLSYTGDRLAGMNMGAYALEDATNLIYGTGTGLSIEREADVYSGVNYPDRNGEDFAGGRYVQDSYVLGNVSVGVNHDGWKVELYVDNVTDEHAVLYIDNQQYTPKVVTNRPRTVGMRMSYDFY